MEVMRLASFDQKLRTFDAAAGIIKHYRVDKMRDTEILEADRKGEESFKNFDLAAFAKKTFGMYGGVDAEVTLECRNELAGVVIDRFGHDVWMCPHGEDHFRTRVLVSVSSQFLGWITGIGFGMIREAQISTNAMTRLGKMRMFE